MLLIKLLIVLEERNDPQYSLRWLFEVHSFVEEWIDRKAIEWGNGVHVKHELMRGIHSFFHERIPENAMVLDIGCGAGALANSIAANVKNVKVIGIDMNKDHIEFAQGNFARDNITFLQGDATQNLPGLNVDVIVLSSFLEHVEKRVEFLKGLVETYNPSLFLIRVPTIERHFHSAMKRDLGIFCYVDKDHKTEYTSESFSQEMSDAGLEVVTKEVRWGDIWVECRSLGKPIRLKDEKIGSMA